MSWKIQEKVFLFARITLPKSVMTFLRYVHFFHELQNNDQHKSFQ